MKTEELIKINYLTFEQKVYATKSFYLTYSGLLYTSEHSSNNNAITFDKSNFNDTR